MLITRHIWARLIAALLIASFLLTSCAPKTPAATTAPATRPAQATNTSLPPTQTPEPSPTQDQMDPTGQRVILWQSLPGSRLQYLRSVIEAFNQNNPYKITVVEKRFSSTNAFFSAVLASLNAGDSPNLIIASQDQIGVFRVANAAVDLNSYVNDPKYGLSEAEKNDIIPAIFSQDVYPTFNNERLGIPLYRQMDMLYYNQDWLKDLGFSAPPKTLDEFKDMACKAAAQKFYKIQSPAEGETIGYGIAFGDRLSLYADLVFAFGGEAYDRQTGKFNFSSDASQKTAELINYLLVHKCAVISESPEKEFAGGRALFTIDSSAGLASYTEAVAKGAQFQWTISAVPHATTDPVQNVYGPSISILKSSPQQMVAAWIFIKTFLTPESQAALSETNGYLPVTSSAASTAAGKLAGSPAKAALDLLPYAHTEPSIPNYEMVQFLINDALPGFGTVADLKAVLDKLTADANALLDSSLKVVPTPVPTSTKKP